jgi:hypothetical protein
MARRRRNSRRRTKRQLRFAALAFGLLVWAWLNHPGWLIAGSVVAALVAGAYLVVRRRKAAAGREGWIYHLPGWPGRPLVYVGQTCWPDRRMRQHQGLQGPESWFAGDVDFTRVKWFGPFPEAQLDRIEADHIHTYEPQANRQRYEEQRRLMLLRHESARSRRTAA